MFSFALLGYLGPPTMGSALGRILAHQVQCAVLVVLPKGLVEADGTLLNRPVLGGGRRVAAAYASRVEAIAVLRPVDEAKVPANVDAAVIGVKKRCSCA